MRQLLRTPDASRRIGLLVAAIAMALPSAVLALDPVTLLLEGRHQFPRVGDDGGRELGRDLTGRFVHSHPDLRTYRLAFVALCSLLVLALAAVLRARSLIRRLRRAEADNLQLVEQLRSLAMTDPLTGLQNRRAGQERAAAEFARSVRSQHPLCLISIDVDLFKRINDRHGHLSGDQVLVAVAHALAGTARRSDTVARVGGEEFLVIATDTTAEGGEASAERLRECVEALRVETDAGPCTVTISLGVAALQPDVADLHALWQRADVALYEAKRRGRNRVVVWREGLDGAAWGPSEPTAEAPLA